MRTIPTAFLQHLQQPTTTLTLCWRLTPQPPTLALGFTEHVEDLIINGLRYQAHRGFAPSALRSTNDLAVDNFEVSFLLSFDGLAEQDLLAGRYDNASIEVFLVNTMDVTMGQVLLATGTLGEITLANGIAKAEIRGLTQTLQQSVVEVTSPTCRAALGDMRCKVDLAAFTVSGSVTSVEEHSAQIFTDSNRWEVDSWFNGGLLTWTSGSNVGLSCEVKHYSLAQQQFILYEPMPTPIQVGDDFQVHRGCDKQLTTCKALFNNVVNFRGEPYLPGNDRIQQIAGL